MIRTAKWMLVTVLCLVTVAEAHAAPEGVPSSNGVPLISGGIGIDSQQRLEAREPEFNLKLVFTLISGNFVSDVRISIRDAKRKILVEHVADGPFLLVKLPAGQYSVNAVYEGTAQARKIIVREGRLHTEYLRWPGNPAVDFALPPEHLQAN